MSRDLDNYYEEEYPEETGDRCFPHFGSDKLIDSTFVVVLLNGEQEIEREVASPADALRVALMMLARRGRLESGDVLKVTAPN